MRLIAALLLFFSIPVFAAEEKLPKTREAEVLEYVAARAIYPSRTTAGKNIFDIIKRDAEKEGRILPDGRIIYYYLIPKTENEFPEIYKKMPAGLNAQDEKRWRDFIDNKLPIPEENVSAAIKAAMSDLANWYEFREVSLKQKANIVFSRHKLADREGQYAHAVTADLAGNDPLNVFKSHIRLRPDVATAGKGALHELLVHELLHAVAGFSHFKEDILDKSPYKGFHIYPYTAMTNLNKAQEENLGQFQKGIGLLDMMVLEKITGIKHKISPPLPIELSFKNGVMTIDAEEKNDEVEYIADGNSPEKSIIKTGASQGCQLETIIEGKKDFIQAACVNNGEVEKVITSVDKGKIVQVNMNISGEIFSKTGNIRIMVQNPVAGGNYIIENSGVGDVKEIAPANHKSIYGSAENIEKQLQYGDVLLLPDATNAKVSQEKNDISLNLLQQGKPIKITLKNQQQLGISTIATIKKAPQGNQFRFLQGTLKNPKEIEGFINQAN